MLCTHTCPSPLWVLAGGGGRGARGSKRAAGEGASATPMQVLLLRRRRRGLRLASTAAAALLAAQPPCSAGQATDRHHWSVRQPLLGACSPACPLFPALSAAGPAQVHPCPNSALSPALLAAPGSSTRGSSRPLPSPFNAPCTPPLYLHWSAKSSSDCPLLLRKICAHAAPPESTLLLPLLAFQVCAPHRAPYQSAAAASAAWR